MAKNLTYLLFLVIIFFFFFFFEFDLLFNCHFFCWLGQPSTNKQRRKKKKKKKKKEERRKKKEEEEEEKRRNLEEIWKKFGRNLDSLIHYRYCVYINITICMLCKY